MQITRQADYAVRAVLYLAQIDQETRATTKQIAKEQNIPASFLAKIIAQLTVAGLLLTTRGVRGGVTLAKDSEDISLLEVVEAIDGPVLMNSCVNDSYNCPIDDCPIRPVWCDAHAELVERLRSTNFNGVLALA